MNIGFRESLIRGAISIHIPVPLLFMNPYLMICAAPIMFYLMTSALTHFCTIKYIWQHWAKHQRTPELNCFAEDIGVRKDEL